MIKAIIFDLDGTLLYTIEDIHNVINESLAHFGLPKLTLSQTTQYVGNGAKKLVERAVGDRRDMTEQVYKYYSVRFAECANDHTNLFEGEREALLKFRERGIELAIVTNKPQDATQNVYEKFLSEFSFCEVIGQSDKYPIKPDPTSTLAIIEKLNLKKQECIFVGDGETDVLCAKAAGIDCVSALWGYRTLEQLSAAGAHNFALNFKELADKVLNA